MDDIEPLFCPDARPGCDSSITRTPRPSWGATRASCARSSYDPRTHRSRPVASFAATCCCAAPGGGHRNIDWDVQEVMTGASRADWLRYRALWFSLLSQGVLRAGTANSDTHSLALERVGYPRNLVFGGHDHARSSTSRALRRRRAGRAHGRHERPRPRGATVDDDGEDDPPRPRSPRRSS